MPIRNRGGRSAAFFDLDKTIIATSSSMAFSRPFYDGGLITRSHALRTAYAQFLFLVGGADERQTTRLRDSLSDLIKGWEVAKVRQIVQETVHEHIDPVVYDEALALIRRHQQNGRDVVIVSASARDVVEPIAQLLGADAVVASELEVKKGFYTGEITFYAYGEAKADAVRALAEDKGYDLSRSFAYSDSITDTPMLDAVGHGFVINPDRQLRAAAAHHGWGALRFKKPVGLHSGPSTRSTVATVLVAAAVVAGIILLARAGRAEDD
ncbi:HAD family hydrolase [Demequina activiva]|uniref:Morphological differentiation-associated protein n=1 Tax=Demequina activiva TaxID=1582364 RepID=A0A919Q0T6_9MICO|nr:HAD family hydrolase [Demequina activiva]GIG53836.1 morphological differentiation-associated protein [Demequina activiva]